MQLLIIKMNLIFRWNQFHTFASYLQKMKFNRRIVLLIILCLAIVVLFLPIKVHYSFDATAIVYPSKEWYFKRGQDDSYISELHDFKANVISHLIGYKFERGDIAEVILKEGLRSDDIISDTDTLAYIHSFDIESEIIELESLIAVEKASLSANLAGEKKSIIDQAQQRLDYANQQLLLEEKNYNRQLKLHNDSVISQADFEIWENSYQLAEINVQIAKNELLSIETGRKSEEIEYIIQKIDSYTREIEMIKKQKSQYYIIPPISGKVSFNAAMDGLVTVSDFSQFLLKIPVKVHNIQYLDRISGIRFSIPGYDDKMDASFIDLDENVNVLANQQLVIAKALVDKSFQGIYAGMAVQCSVFCDEITIFEFLKRGIHLKF